MSNNCILFTQTALQSSLTNTESKATLIINELRDLSYKWVTKKNIIIISLKIKMLITLFLLTFWQKMKIF